MGATRTLLAAALVAGGFTLVAAPPAHAISIGVTNTSDTAPGTCAPSFANCTLRDAILAANAAPGADTILISAGTYTLTNTGAGEDAGLTGDLDVTGSLSIEKVGAGAVIIDGNGTDRVFDVFPASPITFSLSNVTVRNGKTPTTGVTVGGGLYLNNNVTTTLDNVVVTNNDATTNGGGIEARGPLTLTNSTVTGNRAGNMGGGINSASTSATLSVTGSSIQNNQADFGGGLHISHNQGNAATFTDSAITGNQAVDQPEGPPGQFGNGGGIVSDTDGTITLTRTRLTGNNAAKLGGGIYEADGGGAGTGSVTVSLSRITGNAAGASGGGIHQVSGTVSAERNWWGCNAGPGGGGCDSTSGTVDSDPRIVLRHSAGPSSIGTGATSTLTADFLANSDATTNTAADLAAFTGLPVAFSNPVGGSLSNAQATIQSSGTATATFTAGSSGGPGSADAKVDNQTTTANLTITRPSTTVSSIDRQSPAGADTNAGSVTFRVTFAAPVSGVSPSNFALTVGGGIGGASVSTATAVGGAPSAQWDVVVGTGSGNGTIRLDFASDAGVSHNVPPFSSGQSYAVDKATPDTTITAFPTNPTTSANATFAFSGSDGAGSGVAGLECKLDGGTFTACSSPQSYNSLGDGSHTFQVRAVDVAGNTDPTPASYTWVVDTAAPNTTITGNPPNPTNSTSASFSFTGNDGGGSGVAGFQCLLDNGSFTGCTSPQTYTGLSEGSHIFRVRAFDATGTLDPTPASYVWSVDTSGPDTTLQSTPSDPSNSGSPSFGFVGDDGSGSGLTGFECRLDAASFTACTSPQSYAGLSEGSHTFQVRAVDNAGNVDSSPATFTWTIDTTPPVVAISNGPPDPSNTTSPSFLFSANDTSAITSLQCRLETGSFAPCTSPAGLTGVSDGAHTFTVRATDAAGNVGSDSYTWVVDTIAPDTVMDTAPPPQTNSNSAAFTFHGTDSGSGTDHLECRLDAALFTTCTSPLTLPGLAEGTHTFEVRGVDKAGNNDASPASVTWRVDLTSPTVTLEQGPGQSDPTDHGPIHFRVIFSEPVIGFTGSDVAIGGTAGATTPAATEVAPNDGTTYDVTVSGMASAGTVIASVPASSAQDGAGNSSAASTSSDNSVAYDPNHPPAAVADLYVGTEDHPLVADAPGVLANDTDTDAGDALTAVLVGGPAHGHLTLTPSGGFTYTPVADFFGPDAFTYRARDSHGATSSLVVVELTVKGVNDPPTVVSVRGGSCQQGSAASIRLEVSDPDTPLSQLELDGRSSDEGVVTVGDFGGTDARRSASVRGSIPGSAVLTFTVDDGTTAVSVTVGYRAGGSGADVLKGTGRPDILVGRSGADRLIGKGGNDLLCGGGGDDRLKGAGGDDVLDGRGGDDALKGGTGADALRAGAGSDRMAGGPSGDRFLLGLGHDTLVDFSASEGDTKAQPNG